MQQAFKSIKNWNYLQPRSEIEWLTITQDFLKGFPNVHSKQKLELIIALMKFHAEAKKIALLKLHRAIEEDCDPLEQFFQWITVNYEMSKRQKMLFLQKAIENKKFDWQSNPADEIELAIREAQLTIVEITENKVLSNLMKEILRNCMPSAYCLKIAGMNIAEMLQKIPEIWKECGPHEITFWSRKHRCMRNNSDKHHGYHAQITKKKTQCQVRLCYCCQRKGHLAKDSSWNKTMKPSNLG